jgi:O-antigen ligase
MSKKTGTSRSKALPPNNPIESTSNSARVYVGVIFISCLAYSSKVLDNTLVPRFLILSAGFILISIIIYKDMEKKIRIPLNQIYLSLMAYFLLNLFSCFWARNMSEALFESEKIFLSINVFFFSVFFLRKEKDFESLLTKLVCLLILMASVFAFYQIVNLKSFHFESLYKITGISGHKNLFACLLFISLPFTLTALPDAKGVWKLLFILSVVFSILLILFLQTRAVWVGMAVALLLFTLFISLKLKDLKSKKILFTSLKISLAFVLLIAFSGVFFYLKGNLQQATSRLDIGHYAQSETGRERLALWEKSILLINENKILGVGAGNWQTEYPKNSIEGIYSVQVNNHTFQRPHNDFLWVLSETGIAGLSVFVIIFFSVLYRSLKSYLNQQLSKKTFSILLYASALTGFLTISFFDFPKERIELLIFTYTLLAVLHFKASAGAEISEFRSVTISKKFLMLFTLSFLILNIFISVYRLKGEYNMKKVYAYKAKQDWRMVIKFCEKANSSLYTIDPTSIPIAWYKGLANFSLKNNNEALDDFQIAYEICPYNEHVLNNLGSALTVIQKPEEAKKYYLESIRINPSFDDPKFNLAAVYYNEKNYKKAWFWTDKCSDNQPKKKEYTQIIAPYIK